MTTLPAPPSDAEEKARRKKRNDRIVTGIVLLSLTMYVNGFEKSWRDIKRLVKYMVTPAAKAPADPGNKGNGVKGNGQKAIPPRSLPAYPIAQSPKAGQRPTTSEIKLRHTKLIHKTSSQKPKRPYNARASPTREIALKSLL